MVVGDMVLEGKLRVALAAHIALAVCHLDKKCGLDGTCRAVAGSLYWLVATHSIAKGGLDKALRPGGSC